MHCKKWCRLVNMDESLLAKEIFLSHLTKGSTNRKIWCYRVKMFFMEIEHEHICQGHRLVVRATLNTINSQLHVYFENIWREKLNTEFAVRGQDAGGNKLRTYRKFNCSLYDDIRTLLFNEINNISDNFPTLSTDVQFLQIMSNPQYYRSASRAMHNILNRRQCNML